jgi:hypothetical protein
MRVAKIPARRFLQPQEHNLPSESFVTDWCPEIDLIMNVLRRDTGKQISKVILFMGNGFDDNAPFVLSHLNGLIQAQACRSHDGCGNAH